MKSRKEYMKSIIDYYREYYTDGGFPTIFSLQQKMLELGICPKCGTKSHCWSSNSGYFPCDKCGFNISEKELEKVLWDYDDRISDKMKKSILKRRFKPVRNLNLKRSGDEK